MTLSFSNVAINAAIALNRIEKGAEYNPSDLRDMATQLRSRAGHFRREQRILPKSTKGEQPGVLKAVRQFRGGKELSLLRAHACLPGIARQLERIAAGRLVSPDRIRHLQRFCLLLHSELRQARAYEHRHQRTLVAA